MPLLLIFRHSAIIVTLLIRHFAAAYGYAAMARAMLRYAICAATCHALIDAHGQAAALMLLFTLMRALIAAYIYMAVTMLLPLLLICYTC